MMFTCFNILHASLSIFTGGSDILILFIELNGLYFCVWLAFGEIMRDIDVTIGNEFDSTINNVYTDAI
jgi:hypothetical protein